MFGDISEICRNQLNDIIGQNRGECVQNTGEIEIQLTDDTVNQNEKREQGEQQIICQCGSLLGDVVFNISFPQLLYDVDGGVCYFKQSIQMIETPSEKVGVTIVFDDSVKFHKKHFIPNAVQRQGSEVILHYFFRLMFDNDFLPRMI